MESLCHSKRLAAGWIQWLLCLYPFVSIVDKHCSPVNNRDLIWKRKVKPSFFYKHCKSWCCKLKITKWYSSHFVVELKLSKLPKPKFELEVNSSCVPTNSMPCTPTDHWHAQCPHMPNAPTSMSPPRISTAANVQSCPVHGGVQREGKSSLNCLSVLKNNDNNNNKIACVIFVSFSLF